MVGSEIGKSESGSSYGSEKKVYASRCVDSDETTGIDRRRLAFFDRMIQFELEDLICCEHRQRCWEKEAWEQCTRQCSTMYVPLRLRDSNTKTHVPRKSLNNTWT
ncbi:hypothetical protein K1719_023523 [Acacia pycnantha]|nr:hypothetical protein K1719_023523 [Acacia pycnantha]